MKKILITGKNSYIGNAVEEYFTNNSLPHKIEKISLRGEDWQTMDFSGYDTVLHVAGIAHADVSAVSEETKRLYNRVNGELPVLVAQKAKREGVKQFIYLSSVIVYGDSAGVGKNKVIQKGTEPAPANFYGASKLVGEYSLQPMQDDNFQVAIVRLPMVYGKGCKGNYGLLEKIAEKTPVFPKASNLRSMLYIENLAEFIRRLAESGQGGLFFPQNAEYVTTAHMVQLIGRAKGKEIRLWSIFNPFVWLASKVPGSIGNLTNKAFGSLAIDRNLSHMPGYTYQKYSLEESIRRIHEN